MCKKNINRLFTYEMSSKKTERNYLALMIFLFILIGLVWFTYQLWIPHVSKIAEDKDYLANIGLYGDSFGALNTLFSGLAFCGIIISIFLQSQELKETREELLGQKLALEKQNFESTFFQMLRLQNELVGSIDLVNNSNKITNGRDCFKVFYERYKSDYIRCRKEHDFPDEEMNISESYKIFIEKNHHEIGHYFRHLYNIIKFIDMSEVVNKKDYTNIIRAQLSSFESLLIFYNCISHYGSTKFKPLLVKYSLLKTIPDILLISRNHKEQYDEKAFI